MRMPSLYVIACMVSTSEIIVSHLRPMFQNCEPKNFTVVKLWLFCVILWHWQEKRRHITHKTWHSPTCTSSPNVKYLFSVLSFIYLQDKCQMSYFFKLLCLRSHNILHKMWKIDLFDQFDNKPTLESLIYANNLQKVPLASFTY